MQQRRHAPINHVVVMRSQLSDIMARAALLAPMSRCWLSRLAWRAHDPFGSPRGTGSVCSSAIRCLDARGPVDMQWQCTGRPRRSFICGLLSFSASRSPEAKAREAQQFGHGFGAAEGQQGLPRHCSRSPIAARHILDSVGAKLGIAGDGNRSARRIPA